MDPRACRPGIPATPSTRELACASAIARASRLSVTPAPDTQGVDPASKAPVAHVVPVGSARREWFLVGVVVPRIERVGDPSRRSRRSSLDMRDVDHRPTPSVASVRPDVAASRCALKLLIASTPRHARGGSRSPRDRRADSSARPPSAIVGTSTRTASAGRAQRAEVGRRHVRGPWLLSRSSGESSSAIESPRIQPCLTVASLRSVVRRGSPVARPYPSPGRAA